MISSWISLGFSEHVEHGNYTLFENLNWLNRNLQLLLSAPPVQKTEEQAETAIIAASQQKDSKPPVKQQQQTLSVTAPEFTPKASKKKTLFDEDHIRKNKVVIVNDPSLINEQAEEGEVEVELANGDAVEDVFVGQEEEDGEKTLVSLSQPVVRKGTEIRLINPILENVSLFRCSLLHLMVKCARCKDTVEVENIKPEQEEANSSKNQHKTERWMSCPTCSSIMGIKFLGGK
jgi:DNA-directed RNA polymerase subunit RPC12/RpoP